MRRVLSLLFWHYYVTRGESPVIKILHGDDEFSIFEAVRKTKIAVGPEEARDPNTTVLESAAFKPFDIIAAASSMPFLADRRLVLVYGLLGRLDARGANTGTDWDTVPGALADLPGTSDVVFVEVRTRRRGDFGLPSESVDRRKWRRMMKAADRFLRARRAPEASRRYDIVSILWPSGGEPQVDLIRGALPGKKFLRPRGR